LVSDSKSAIGASSERVSAFTEEEEALFSETQNRLASLITEEDIRVPLQQAVEIQNGAGILVEALNSAWDVCFGECTWFNQLAARHCELTLAASCRQLSRD
jgi:hypothetical protein